MRGREREGEEGGRRGGRGSEGEGERGRGVREGKPGGRHRQFTISTL